MGLVVKSLLKWCWLAPLGYVILLVGTMIYPFDPVLDKTGKFERKFHLSADFPFIGSYLLMKPKRIEEGGQYPLVVTLHDSYKRSLAAYHLADKKLQDKFPSYVMLPSSAFNQPWGRFFEEKPGPSFSLKLAMEAVADIQQDPNIDKNRIYVTGASMGAIGTFAAMAYYPDIFAAGMPVNGRWTMADAKRFSGSTLSVFQGKDNPVFQAHKTRELIKRIREEGGAANYFELPDLGHTSEPVYRETGVWQWLFDQKRSSD